MSGRWDSYYDVTPCASSKSQFGRWCVTLKSLIPRESVNDHQRRERSKTSRPESTPVALSYPSLPCRFCPRSDLPSIIPPGARRFSRVAAAPTPSGCQMWHFTLRISARRSHLRTDVSPDTLSVLAKSVTSHYTAASDRPLSLDCSTFLFSFQREIYIYIYNILNPSPRTFFNFTCYEPHHPDRTPLVLTASYIYIFRGSPLNDVLDKTLLKQLLNIYRKRDRIRRTYVYARGWAIRRETSHHDTRGHFYAAYHER